MTTKILTGTYTGGYNLLSPVTTLSIATTGYVEGPGISEPNPRNAYTVINTGKIKSTGDGIYLRYGSPGSGAVTNGSSIDTSAVIEAAGNAIQAAYGGAITNFGTIFSTGGHSSAILLTVAGSVINGTLNDTKAMIEGQTAIFDYDGVGVTNFGTIDGIDTAVVLTEESSLTNGALTDRGALIEGYTGVHSNKGALTGYTSVIDNFATIKGVGNATQAAVYLGGGSLTNGSAVDTSALLEAYSAVTASNGGSVTNFGVINGTGPAIGVYGVLFTDGGGLTNGSAGSGSALVEGYTAVEVRGAAGTVANFGTIKSLGAKAEAGVYLAAGGLVTNGAVNDLKAVIEGVYGVVFQDAGTLNNFGSIEGSNDFAVVLNDGGRVTNGAATDPDAIIDGLTGVVLQAAGTVANFGTIQSSSAAAPALSLFGGEVNNGAARDRTALVSGAVGVDLTASGTVNNYATITGESGAGVVALGGKITNSGGPDTTALIQGAGGVVEGALGTVVNLGVIDGSTSVGVVLDAGSSLTNGAASQTSALIEGVIGVELTLGGTVSNLGTVDGGAAYGVEALGGGRIVNGSGANRAALIEGGNAIWARNDGVTVVNFGIVVGGGGSGSFGVYLKAGGSLTNGNVNDHTALIQGYGGVRILGVGDSTNFGTIQGLGDNDLAFGFNVGTGGDATNGSASDTSALMEGYFGAELGGNGTLTNFGTISGANGIAVKLINSAATLAVEGGSVLDGVSDGDGGTLALVSGAGALSGLSGDDVTVSGSMPTAVFGDFDTLQIGAAASFSLAANGSIAAGGGLVDSGALSLGGTLTSDGAVTTTGSLSGAGALLLAGGTAAFNAGTSLTVADVIQVGSTTATISDADLAYAGVWDQTGGALSVSAGDEIDFTGVGNLFEGTLSGAGTVAFTAGSNVLVDTTFSAASAIVDGATLTLGGSLDLATTLVATTPEIVVGAAGVILTGKGTLELTNAATNTVIGASDSATLTNSDDTIAGAGQLGEGVMKLVNDAGATIDGDGSVGLTINTGSANTIVNAGVIESTAGGGVTIESPIDNTGTLVADGGTLTLAGSVSGTGKVHISGATADLAAGFTQAVDFTGTTGELELASSKTYTGQISGFSKTGTTSLDLLDIAFAGTTTAVYTGNTTSGVLTVTEGANTAKITLEGDYLTSTFTLSAAPGGGTLVVDPPRTAGPALSTIPPHPFIAAMAGFGALAGGSVGVGGDTWRTPPPTLVASKALA